jgi:DNA polymerase-3 subunit gamma/tau
MPVLARAWQMLLKGLEEVQVAPSPAQAAQMVLVRLAYVADLPVPAELVRTLTGGAPATPIPVGQAQASGPLAPTLPSPASGAGSGRGSAEAGAMLTTSPALAVAAPITAPPVATEAVPPRAEFDPMPQSFAETVALFDTRREAMIAAHLKANVRLVSFEPGRIEIHPLEAAPANLTNQLGAFLSEWTGTRWIVAVSQAEGAPSLAEEEARRGIALRHEVATHPLVRAVLETFPGATIAAVRERFNAADAGNDATPDEVGDTQGEDDVNAGEDNP